MTLAEIRELQATKQREEQVKAAQKTKRTVWVQLLQDVRNPFKWYVLKYYKNGRHYTIKQYIGANAIRSVAVRIHARTAHTFLTSCEFI